MRSKDSRHRIDQQFDWVQQSKNPCTASLTDTWSDITAENGQSNSEQLALVNRPVTRRAFVAGSGLLLGGGVVAGALNLMSRPVLAAGGWIANGAEITTDDGRVDSITFGDPDEESDPESGDNRLVVEWSGFNSSENTAEFDVLLKGSDSDSEGWDGDAAEWNSIIVEEADDPADATLEGTSGEETYSWNDVFGMHRPADVEEHPEISLTDFQQTEDGESRERVVDVRVEVDVPGEGLTAYADAEATITVSNKGAEISVGGQGSFHIEASD